MSLHWNSDLESGIFELDLKQQELYAEFEDFPEKIEGHGPEEIGRFIDYLDGYAREYFRFEEHLQEKSHFPGHEGHAMAHRHFIEELAGFKARLVAGEEAKGISLALKGMMIRWIITHSNHLDKEFNDYLLAASAAAGRDLIGKKFGNILVDSGRIGSEVLEQALTLQKESGKLLGAVLVEMGAIDLQEVIDAQAIQKGMLPAEDHPVQ